MKDALLKVLAVMAMCIILAACPPVVGPDPDPSPTPWAPDLSVLPGGYSVPLPASLLKDSGAVASISKSLEGKALVSRSLMGHRAVTATSRAVEDESWGYATLRDTVDYVADVNKFVAKAFITADQAVKDLTGPEEVWQSPMEIVMTQEIVDAIQYFAPNYDPALDTVYDPFVVGESIEYVPYFAYLSSAQFPALVDETVVDTEGFDYLVFFDYYSYWAEWGEDWPLQVYIFWSQDKSKVKVLWDWFPADDPDINDGSDDPYTIEMGYDSGNKISSLIYQDEAYPWVWNETEGAWYQDTSGAKATSLYSVLITSIEADSAASMIRLLTRTMLQGETEELVVDGFADDSGGYVETLYSWIPADGGFDERYIERYRELFEAGGVLNGAQFYDTALDDGDATGWEDAGALAWPGSSETYDDEFVANEGVFDDAVDASAVDEGIDSSIPGDSRKLDVVLPAALTWDAASGEVEKTFAITSDGQKPATDGSNIIGYQALYKDEYERAPADTRISFIMKGVSDHQLDASSFDLYEVKRAEVPVDDGVEASTLFRVSVEGAVRIVQAASGIFSSSAASINPAVPGINPVTVTVPDLSAASGLATDPKVLFLTSDGSAPRPDGTNVVAMRKITKASGGQDIVFGVDEEDSAKSYGTYVYDDPTVLPDGSKPALDTSTPEVQKTVTDANGDNDMDEGENDGTDSDEEGEDDDEEEDATLIEPTDPAIVSNSAEGVELSWKRGLVTDPDAEDDDIDGYRIYRSDKGILLAYASTTGTTWKDSARAAGTVTYTIKSYKGPVLANIPWKVSGTGVSIEVAAPAVKPEAPASVNASDTAQTGVTISWSLAADTDVESYEVWRRESSKDADGNWVDIGEYALVKAGVPDTDGQATETWTDTAVSLGKRYSYKVKAKDEEDNVLSDLSIADYGEMLPFTAPVTLTASTDQQEKVVLSWAATAGADFYIVYRAPKASTSYTQIAFKVTATTYDDASAKPNDGSAGQPEYDYYVTAALETPANESGKSPVATGKRGAAVETPAPTGLRWQDRPGSAAEALFSWDPLKANPMPELRLEESKDSGATWAVNAQNGDLATVTAATAYKTSAGQPAWRFRLRADYGSGNVKYSNVVSIDPPSPYQAISISSCYLTNPDSQFSSGAIATWAVPDLPAGASGTVRLYYWHADYNEWKQSGSGKYTTDGAAGINFSSYRGADKPTNQLKLVTTYYPPTGGSSTVDGPIYTIKFD